MKSFSGASLVKLSRVSDNQKTRPIKCTLSRAIYEAAATMRKYSIRQLFGVLLRHSLCREAVRSKNQEPRIETRHEENIAFDVSQHFALKS